MRPILNYSSWQRLVESRREIRQPEYFNLPYLIPEDRFENGLLRGNDSRRGTSRRETFPKGSKYSGREEFWKVWTPSEIEKWIQQEVYRVVKFINNNPLTGRRAKAKWVRDPDLSLEEYLEGVESGEDVALGRIETQLPFFTWGIRVDWDIYKGVTVFTFLHEGDLFYFYGTWTLEPNDVTGSGEHHTWITASEVIEWAFYETIWRETGHEWGQIGLDLEEVGFPEIEDRDLNSPVPVTQDYFNPKFVRMFSNWCRTGDPMGINKRPKFDLDIISPWARMTVPGEARWEKTSAGPSEWGGPGEPSSRVHIFSSKEEGEPDWSSGRPYLAIRINYTEKGILSVESAPFPGGRYDWKEMQWSQLGSEELEGLQFEDRSGRPVKIKNLMI